MPQISNHQPLQLFEQFCKKNDIDGKEISAKISGVLLKLKVCSTKSSQEKGYSQELNGPSENKGMLFVYDEDQPLSFWMKEVKFPLDIIFFDSSLEYIDHHTMAPGHDVADHDLPKYQSKKPARFAVELPGGWCEKNMSPKCKLSF
jgi:uncharacterized protein